MRAEELYQLTIDDMDIDDRVIHINHNPSNGQSTKTKISRISFFTEGARHSLEEYLTYFDSDRSLKQLFSQSHITRLFRKAPLQVKDLRKFFSQEWDRKGGPTSIKKILMGHSMKGDVDLMHYNAQSEKDLKKIYDKVMNSIVNI
jgi:integrase/recombinase XerD